MKRAALSCAGPRGWDHADSGSGPVSYTHLDLRKIRGHGRQLFIADLLQKAFAVGQFARGNIGMLVGVVLLHQNAAAAEQVLAELILEVVKVGIAEIRAGI